MSRRHKLRWSQRVEAEINELILRGYRIDYVNKSKVRYVKQGDILGFRFVHIRVPPHIAVRFKPLGDEK